jgi:hypothetical protein
MLYKIADGREVDIQPGNEVRLLKEYQEKFPDLYRVIEALETYMIVEIDGQQYGFDPSLIEDVRGSGSAPSDEELNPQVAAIVKTLLPEMVQEPVAQAVRDLVTPELIREVAGPIVEEEVRRMLAEQLIKAGELLKSGG